MPSYCLSVSVIQGLPIALWAQVQGRTSGPRAATCNPCFVPTANRPRSNGAIYSAHPPFSTTYFLQVETGALPNGFYITRLIGEGYQRIVVILEPDSQTARQGGGKFVPSIGSG